MKIRNVEDLIDLENWNLKCRISRWTPNGPPPTFGSLLGVNCLVTFPTHFNLSNSLLKLLQVALLFIWNPSLVTGPKGSREFCFPETLIMEGREETKLSFPWDQSFSVLLHFLTKKKEVTARNYLLDVGWHTNLPRFQYARPDHVRVESSSFCFSRG